MTNSKKSKIFILDTSVILSGKPINFEDFLIITTPNISNELKPGGKDYQNFQFLKEKGLTFRLPTKESIDKINKVTQDTGDAGRLSDIDKEILALALDHNKKFNVVILTDDYSIQNVASYLKMKFESINQNKISKRFKWACRCRGCGKKFNENIIICPICGSEIKKIVVKDIDIKD